ncbi:ATP-binding cassette domain-containing protein, partial [Butyricicoccus sp. 1XD8-22]
MIEITQVEKVYTTASQSMKAVQSMDLTIQEGEILGIVGESGSGKSTLGKMIIGLEAPTSGTITYQGKSLWNKNKYFR